MSSIDKEIKIFSGNASKTLAEDIAGHLKQPLGDAVVKSFSDGETWVEINESVRGLHIFLIQSTYAPANQNLMEMLIMVDALKRASVASVTAVIPYYGYARQDRKSAPRTPISSKLVADLLSTAGVDRVVSMDLHAGQIQGFFDVPFDHLYAKPVLLKYIQNNLSDNLVMVSPDAGGVDRARSYAKHLGCPVAMIDKRRDKPNVAEVMNVIGEVEGKRVIILDDMVDTAGTLTSAAQAILNNGATEVFACATHPVLSGPAIERIEKSCLKKLIVTDTIPLSESAKKCGRIECLSVSALLADAIKRIHEKSSISELFV
ncbi:ribose-phosphate pyrophosphokinase [bacterium]|nr:ribose-phosphate pyrophosphokinase [bacterium]